MEELIKKKVGNTIPHELIYNIIDDLDNIRRMKKKDKSNEIKEVLQELNEAASIADEAYNSTRSEAKKKKIEIFIRYNNARLKLVEDYVNNGMYDTKLNRDFLCPDDKKFNSKSKRCVKKNNPELKKVSRRPPVFNKDKICPDDKILNPATGRCVSKKGTIGKKLLKEVVE